MAESNSKSVKKKTARPFITPQHVRDFVPLVDAGLAALSMVSRKARPVASALRVVTNVGATALPDDLLQKIKNIRTRIKELEEDPKGNSRALRQARSALEAHLDMLLGE